MKYVLQTLKYGEDYTPVLLVIQYHYDCEVIVIDSISGHGICPLTLVIRPNVISPNIKITDVMYNRCILMLQEAGIS